MYAITYPPLVPARVVELTYWEVWQAERQRVRLYRFYLVAELARRVRPAAYCMSIVRDDGSRLWLGCKK